MTDVLLADFFPRLHTAIAEWIACTIYIIPQKRRFGAGASAALSALFLAVLLMANIASERADELLWIALMAVCMAAMFLMILCSCEITVVEAVYKWAHAFIAAEFAASLEWQINCYLLVPGVFSERWQTYLCMAAVYLVVFGLLHVLNKRLSATRERRHVRVKEAVGALAISLTAFGISNFNFAFKDNIFTQMLGTGVLYSRTLIDFAGLIMLYAHDEARAEMNLSMELEAMRNLLNRQYEQYRMFERNNKALHRIYHDLKHWISFIREEPNSEKRESYLREIDHALSTYSADVKTGNSVLDTLLTSKRLACVEHNITMVCYADAHRMDVLDVIDICSIFGNAIDNAIECVEKIADPQKRLIKVNVHTQSSFLLIRIQNYCEEPVDLSGGVPATTKEDKVMHGYGVKSIQYTAEKYRGCVTLEQEDEWFTVTVLIPLAQGG